MMIYGLLAATSTVDVAVTLVLCDVRTTDEDCPKNCTHSSRRASSHNGAMTHHVVVTGFTVSAVAR